MSSEKIKNKKYRRVKGLDIEIGSPLISSVYSKENMLLLKKGRIITTQHQKLILVNSGYILKSVKKELTPPLLTSAKNERYNVKGDIFDIKSRWLEELYLVFNLAEKEDKEEKENTNFSHRILTLALEIQEVHEFQPNALLAAFQLDNENHYGLVHALHCAVLCEAIAKSLKVPRVERLGILAGALTHDLGIVTIQDKLHKQKESLSDEQWKDVQQHSRRGHQKLIDLGVSDKIWLEIALHHHERLNGTGYPDQLKADEMALGVRIMSIVDIYTAMIRPTIFRAENSGKTTLTILYKEKGISLDANLVDVLINKLGVFPLGTLVKLANGETAVVTKRGDVKSKPIVTALLGLDTGLYKKPVERDTALDEFKIKHDLSLVKHQLLQSQIEKFCAKQ